MGTNGISGGYKPNTSLERVSVHSRQLTPARQAEGNQQQKPSSEFKNLDRPVAPHNLIEHNGMRLDASAPRGTYLDILV